MVWEKENGKEVSGTAFTRSVYPLGSILVWRIPISELLVTTAKLALTLSLTLELIAANTNIFWTVSSAPHPYLHRCIEGISSGLDGFDPTIYFDSTIEDETEVDDEQLQKTFPFISMRLAIETIHYLPEQPGNRISTMLALLLNSSMLKTDFGRDRTRIGRM